MNLSKLTQKRPILFLLALCTFAASAFSASLTIYMEAHREAIVDVFTPDAVDIPGSPEYMLPGNDQMLAYIAFDLTRLPQGSRIVEAAISVFDAEPLLEDVNEIALLNVPTDWEAATLSFNAAVAQYGAAQAMSSQNYDIAVYDTDKVLWLGSAVMDNTDAPGEATINSTRDFQSVDPYVDDELVEALNEDLVNDDGLVTLAIRGQSGEDNFLIGIDYPDGEAGPTLTVVLALPGGGGETTAYDFDDGTLQGWTQVSTSSREGGPTELGLISDTDPAVGNSVPPLALSSPSFLGPVPFEAEDNTNTRDQAHDTLVVRSPEFSIYPNGQISFALIGGAKPNFDFETVNADGLPEASSGSGAIGVALRRVSDGEYLAFRARATDGSQFWETITLGEEDLAGLVEEEETYTLDFVDYNSGGWGWAALDSVIIVEGAGPKSSSIAVSRNDQGEIVVTFEGQLQFAPTVNGPWSDVDATSPYTWKPESSMQFGRSVSR